MKKRVIALFSALVLIVVSLIGNGITINAEVYMENNYKYTVNNNEARIIGTKYTAAGDVNIPSTLGEYPVTSIDPSTFKGNELLTGVNISNGIKSIEMGAFSGCINLRSVSIPDSVTYIGRFAFSGCSFNEIIIPDNVGNIDDFAFYGCRNLYNIKLGSSLKRIGEFAFNECYYLRKITVPDSVIYIGGSAFEGCGLSEVNLGSGITSIGADAFLCSGIEKVNINSIDSWCKIIFSDIQSNPLNYAKKLYINDVLATDIEVPKGISKINNYAFYNCESIQSITIPNSVTEIGNYAFYGCTSLVKVNINDIYSWCKIIFSDTYSNPLNYAKKLYINDVLATDIILSNGITSLFDYVFWNCENIKSIRLPNGITSIGSLAFYSCTGLTDIFLPDTLTEIGRSAFHSTNIKDIWYCGSETDRLEIQGEDLNSANWHYDSCDINKANVYDNACDSTCNICGHVRTVPEHVYDNDCDTTCNICGYIRTVPEHVYDNACDTTCNICGYTRTVPEHIYDNACDTTCNICGYIRTVPEHVYDNACDTTCNICGYIRTVPEHVYDNVCDNDCNICAYERIPPHEYDNACDTTCNSCGLVRTVPNHVYSSACDATCDICGHERTAPHKYDNDCDTKCNICRYYRTIKHTYEKNPVWSFNSTNHWQKCYVCNNTTVEEEHVYDNDTDITCNICGYTRSIDNGFTVSESSKLESFNLPHLKTVPSGYTGIYTYSDLQKINNNPTGKYILMKDIDLYTDTENGISSSVISSDFSGIFNGNGYSISNLNISQTNKSNAGAGLFSHNKGTICNLKIKTFSIWSGTYNVNGSAISGAVAMQNSGIVTNCIVENPFISSFGGTTVASGGIVGINNPTGTIEYCMVVHNIKNYLISAIGIPESKTSDSYSGGICGKNLGNISCCGNKSNTASDAANYAYTGGISAYNSGKIENCYNTGTVLFYKNSKTSYYGSAVGYNDRSGSIENVYCNKDALCAQGDNTDNIRILLVHQNFGSVTNCYIEYLSIGGIDITVGEWGEKISNYQMKKADTYKGFDFNTVWIMGTYPELRAYDYSTCINDLNHSGGKATCQNKAVCEYCGISYGEKAEHSYDEWRTVYAPNCSKTGLKVHHCIYCGLEETENIPKDNRHAYTEGDDICYLCGHKWVLITGDINGDEEIDGRDVITLCSYLANYDYDSGISSVDIFDGADANADGFVDGRDVIIVCAYLANYDYDTGSSTIVLG